MFYLQRSPCACIFVTNQKCLVYWTGNIYIKNTLVFRNLKYKCNIVSSMNFKMFILLVLQFNFYVYLNKAHKRIKSKIVHVKCQYKTFTSSRDNKRLQNWCTCCKAFSRWLYLWRARNKNSNDGRYPEYSGIQIF